MRKGVKGNTGKVKLLEQYRKAFHIPENINYYSEEDYKNAERRFIKYAMLKGDISFNNTEHSIY